MYPTLLTEHKDGILIITINRPDKLNALNKDVITDLSKAVDELCSNPELKAAILTGAGEKSFVAGADITEFIGKNAEEGASIAQVGQDNVFSKIENCPKPIIAAVNGFSLGGGCELAMACHFRTASVKAKFGQPEVNLGLIPGYGGTQRLAALIGKGKAMELLMTADMIGAEEAKNLGLVNHVFEVDQLLEETEKIVRKIMTKAPVAVSKIIALVNEATTVSPTGLANEVTAFGECFETEDMKEGTTAFVEKRAAAFQGK